MLDPFSPVRLETVIAATVVLDDALVQTKFSQARHHARIIALRATIFGFPDIAHFAQAVMDALGHAIRPKREVWSEALEALHRAIDDALDIPLC
ncbi:hypothetical protein P3W23_09145 [Luteibacter sp. PPL554]